LDMCEEFFGERLVVLGAGPGHQGRVGGETRHLAVVIQTNEVFDARAVGEYFETIECSGVVDLQLLLVMNHLSRPVILDRCAAYTGVLRTKNGPFCRYSRNKCAQTEK